MKRLVFSAAVMDMLHEGHVNVLKEMRLVAGPEGMTYMYLHSDLSTFANKGRFPVQSLDHRETNLRATGLVDGIGRVHEADPTAAFQQFKLLHGEHFELHFLRGNDWADFPGRRWLEENKIPIHLIGYTEGISSTMRREEASSR